MRLTRGARELAQSKIDHEPAEPIEIIQARRVLDPGTIGWFASAAHAAGRHLGAFEPQFLLHTGRAMAGMSEPVIEDRLLDLDRDTVRVRALVH